jgi:hypothetical protein
MHWIDLAQDRDRRRAVMNTVTNLRVPQNAANFWTTLQAAQEGLCSTELVHGWSYISRIALKG